MGSKVEWRRQEVKLKIKQQNLSSLSNQEKQIKEKKLTDPQKSVNCGTKVKDITFVLSQSWKEKKKKRGD